MTRLLELVRHEMESAIRTRRILAVASLYLGAAMLAGVLAVMGAVKAEDTVVASFAELSGATETEIRAELRERSDEMMDEVLTTIGVDPSTIAQPLKSSPIAAAFFWGSLAFLPFLVVLATFDSVSTDLAGRTLCYSTLRAPRPLIVIAKVIAQGAIVIFVTALSAAAVFAVGVWRLDTFAVSTATLSWAWISILLVPYALAYVAITTWCSSSTDRPLIALVRAAGVLIVLRMALLPSLLLDESDGVARGLAPLRFLSPANYHDGMWQTPGVALASSALAYSLFAVVFTLLAVLAVRKRDL